MSRSTHALTHERGGHQVHHLAPSLLAVRKAVVAQLSRSTCSLHTAAAHEGGELPRPLSPPSAGVVITPLEGGYSANKDLPPNTSKGGCFSVNNLGTRKLLFARQNSSKRPKQTFAGILPQNGCHLPQFPEEKGGGAHNFPDSFARVILEFS